MARTGEILRRLSSFSRLIFFDRRGTGASDSVARNAIPTWEEWTEDIGAVLDVVGSKTAAILASLDAGPMAMLYAAMHPERVSSLALLNTSARFMADDDYPLGLPVEYVDSFVEMIRSMWGTEEFARLTNPAVADDDEFIEQITRTLRAAATPRTAAAQYDYILRNDVRQALPLIQAPTLVMNVRESVMLPLEQGRWLAEQIPGRAVRRT